MTTQPLQAPETPLGLRTRFDALYAAATDQRDPAAGLELAWMLVHMRARQPHPDLDRAWEAALSTPWDRPDALLQGALAYVALHPAVERALAEPADAAALRPAIEYLSNHRLLQRVLAGVLVTPLAWQGLLLRWRALGLLQGASSVPGVAWIALQANLTQYVWPLDVPQAALAALRQRVGSGSPTAGDVMLLACFEHPGERAEDALLDDDPAQQLLVRRLFSEPTSDELIAGELRSHAAAPLTRNAQRDQYERYPYPNWIAEPLLPAAIPAAVRPCLKKSWWRSHQVLLAGCGTGLQCLSARATYADSSITAIDFSVTSLAYAVRKCREAGINDLSFETADLLAYARRGKRFDLVECIGVLHHLSELEAGAAALGALTRPGGLLRLAVYSAPARQSVRELRAMIAARGLDGSLQSLREVRSELLAGRHGAVSPAMLESPDLHSASGLHDLLFNACEHSLGAVEWSALMRRHGFELICMDPPAATLAAAGTGAQAWGPAEWEAYERTHPFAFASMYVFWLTRSA